VLCALCVRVWSGTARRGALGKTKIREQRGDLIDAISEFSQRLERFCLSSSLPEEDKMAILRSIISCIDTVAQGEEAEK